MEKMTIKAAIINPILQALPVVMNNPTGRKLPKGYLAGQNRAGRTNIELWCDTWQWALNTWPAILDTSDYEQAEKAFTLCNQLYPDR